MRDLAIGPGSASLLAMLLGGPSACSMPAAEDPPQTPMPELTVSAVREHVIGGQRCEIAGTLTNTGSIPVQNAEFRLVHHYDTRLEVVTSLRLGNRAVRESRPFQMPYACDSLVGPRLFRAYIGDLPVRVIER